WWHVLRPRLALSVPLLSGREWSRDHGRGLRIDQVEISRAAQGRDENRKRLVCVTVQTRPVHATDSLRSMLSTGTWFWMTSQRDPLLLAVNRARGEYVEFGSAGKARNVVVSGVGISW